jgi:DNA-binding CsgD family transcriptional regulator
MKDNSHNETVNLALVLGYIATKDLTTTEKKVGVLAQLGYSNIEMSKICGTSSKVIKTLKSKVKKGE